ncbi:hypothetical protein I3760_05G026200 [Carya illinoinensis]|uniref:Uncharacterized protein n=1 Tax=Carya illinoinensis TaxID=32201 RepID=A0A922JJI8_CARIL|nr:hypothetical protein I3760_05G026200 [Carya illinoinensis]KAG6710901.1 hypothetical protein I3842_05G026500 [Carya illinoinensis]
MSRIHTHTNREQTSFKGVNHHRHQVPRQHLQARKEYLQTFAMMKLSKALQQFEEDQEKEVEQKAVVCDL